MANCYVKAYYDWIEQTAALSDAERGRLFIAILEYARSGLEPKLDGREGILFPTFKVMLDRDAQKSAINSSNGAKGGRGRKQIEANESELKRIKANESEQKPTKDIRQKTEDNEKDNSPPNPPQGGVRKFVPPSVEEVKAYCESRKNSVDAETFVNFYAAKGWVIGKSPMKNWQAAIRTWEQKRKGSDYNGLADRGGDAPGGSTKDWGNLQSIPLD
jgi:hypothetical protein